jgi:tripartite-type tricarboxylate transporter receptor subunit TctC
MFGRRKLLRTLAVASLLLGPASWTFAQGSDDFPSRRVTFVVAFPPGGGADILGRVIANRLSESWKQPVVVENRSGAAGTIGANMVANSAPDGYTWLVGASGAVTSANAKALTAVSLLSVPPLIVTVNAAEPIKTLGELIARAKAQPEKVFYASSGPGSSTHLTGQLFQDLTGTKLTHVPYKGMGQAVGDLLGGQVTVMFGPPPVMLPHVRSGKLRALAVTTKERSPLYPDIPTAAEQGLPGFESGVWYGVLAPAKTPRSIVTKVSAEIAKVLNAADVREALSSVGASGVGGTPEAFAQFLEKDIARMEELLKKAGVAPPGQ